MAYDTADFWTKKARAEGYPARSVYKLAELGEKFGLLKTRGVSPHILDIGAAPGSWSLYLLRKFPPSRKTGGVPAPLLAAADLVPLSREFDKGLFDRDDFFFVQGDVTGPGVRAALLERGPYTLVLSDAAPATTGNRTVDAGRSLALAETALSLADEALARGGNLAVKVFQGEDSGGLLARIKERFERAQSFKPKACRAASFETYLVGLGKQ